MKAISIIQPWATLIAIGEKDFETRSWATKYHGPIAIHASKKIDKKICRLEPFHSALAEHGYDESNLPTGAIVAFANLEGCYKVDKDCGEYAVISDDFVITSHEYKFGDYSAGRYAWAIVNRKWLEEPILAKGHLGIWNWEGDEIK